MIKYIFIFVLFKISIGTSILNDNRTIYTMEGPVTHGEKADIRLYSYAGLLRLVKLNPPYCSASLISAQVILTAASCTAELDIRGGKITAYFGHNIPKNAKVIRTVVNAMRHPNYDSEKKSDNMAVGFLDLPVLFLDTVKKVTLASAKEMSHRKMGYSAGWGTKSLHILPQYETTMFNQLKETEQYLLTREECRQRFGRPVHGVNTICSISFVGQLYTIDAGAGLVYKKQNYFYLGAVFSHIIDGTAFYTRIQIPLVHRLVLALYNETCNISDNRRRELGLTDYTRTHVGISVGANNKYKGLNYTALLFVLHPRFESDTLANDIALIRARTKLKLGPNIKRAILVQSPPKAKLAYIAGWGKINEDTKINSNTFLLKMTEQIIINRSECVRLIKQVPKGTFCTKGSKAHGMYGYAARGDSGSGLIGQDFVVRGIVSYKNMVLDRSLVVFTDVSYFYAWITSTSKRLYCIKNK